MGRSLRFRVYGIPGLIKEDWRIAGMFACKYESMCVACTTACMHGIDGWTDR